MKVLSGALTFNELVEYGKGTGAEIFCGYPWSFVYKGHPITHENNECYLVENNGETLRMTPVDMLLSFDDGQIAPCNKVVFDKIIEEAK